ncbi:hypothetical protein P7C70_g8354, partial [Phenoliferia sp. Uapishka_3]
PEPLGPPLDLSNSSNYSPLAAFLGTSQTTEVLSRGSDPKNSAIPPNRPQASAVVTPTQVLDSTAPTRRSVDPRVSRVTRLSIEEEASAPQQHRQDYQWRPLPQPPNAPKPPRNENFPRDAAVPVPTPIMTSAYPSNLKSSEKIRSPIQEIRDYTSKHSPHSSPSRTSHRSASSSAPEPARRTRTISSDYDRASDRISEFSSGYQGSGRSSQRQEKVVPRTTDEKVDHPRPTSEASASINNSLPTSPTSIRQSAGAGRSSIANSQRSSLGREVSKPVVAVRTRSSSQASPSNPSFSPTSYVPAPTSPAKDAHQPNRREELTPRAAHDGVVPIVAMPPSSNAEDHATLEFESPALDEAQPLREVGVDLPPQDVDEVFARREAEVEPELDLKPRFEFALTVFPTTILVSLLHSVSYRDFRALRMVSKTLRRSFEGGAKEIVLQRYLGPVGYRSFAAIKNPQPSGGQQSSHHSTFRTSHREASDPARGHISLSAAAPESIELGLQDVDAFRRGIRYSVRDLARYAKDHAKSALPVHMLVMIRSTTRAHNRIVLRIRSQSKSAKDPHRLPYHFSSLPSAQPLLKSGRAPLLRVWVPSKSGWMDDSEMVECEREVWRSGMWAHTRRGDVVHNVALGDFGNEGKLISDGKFLRDLAFTYDVIGHLPFLDMLHYPPAYYHNVVASSTSTPVFHVCLSAFAGQVRERLQLCDETVNMSSPQGTYSIRKFVYRSMIKIKPGHLLGSSGGAGGMGPGGVEVVDQDWAGTVTLETDGTSEHAAALLARCATQIPTPFRIVREKSRPGHLWLRPVLEIEKVN